MTKKYSKRAGTIWMSAAAIVAAACAPACTTTAQEETHGIEASYKVSPSEATCPGEDDDTAAARKAIADVRAMAGLPALRCDEKAMAAAAAHCAYVRANHVFTHVEEPGKPAFTGVNFWDRMAVKGFGEAPASEVLSDQTGELAIDGEYGLVNSVYHRAAFLRAENTSFGYGHDLGCATIDFGMPAHPRASQRVVWPPDGARNVPTTFHADHESPNPVPGYGDVGSPVSVIGPGSLKHVHATIESANGDVLDAIVITAANDPNKLVRVGEAHLVPLHPLAAGATYVAKFEGSTYEDEGEDGGFTLSTTFTTGGP